jgi:RIO-like serine/threonine protein kinase
MKFNKNKIEKTMKILERLRYSGLNIPQIIDAFRRFVLARLDYTMMNNIMGTTELSSLNQYIRNTINEMIGGPALSKDLFYAANKNGG